MHWNTSSKVVGEGCRVLKVHQGIFVCHKIERQNKTTQYANTHKRTAGKKEIFDLGKGKIPTQVPMITQQYNPNIQIQVLSAYILANIPKKIMFQFYIISNKKSLTLEK